MSTFHYLVFTEDGELIEESTSVHGPSIVTQDLPEGMYVRLDQTYFDSPMWLLSSGTIKYQFISYNEVPNAIKLAALLIS